MKGKYYWCVVRPMGKKEDWVYVNADVAEIGGGILAFYNFLGEGDSTEKQLVLAYAPGEWKWHFSASSIDETPIAVDKVDTLPVSLEVTRGK